MYLKHFAILSIVSRIQIVPMVSCQERISYQSFSIPLDPVLTALQRTAWMWMTSSRLELLRRIVTQLRLLMTLFRSMDMKEKDHWPVHWVPWNLSQRSLIWITTICKVGARGLRSWRICTGQKTSLLMRMVMTYNSCLTKRMALLIFDSPIPSSQLLQTTDQFKLIWPWLFYSSSIHCINLLI